MDFDFWQQVLSDVAIGEQFLAPDTLKSESINQQLALRTLSNNMKLNVDKSKYMIFTRSKESFSTCLTINNKPLDRAQEMVHLGVWITPGLTWQRHITEICKRAYPRIRMLTKLKYVFVSTEDLVELYCLHICSLNEYCSTSFHSSLSKKHSNKIETVQKTCLKYFWMSCMWIIVLL